MLPSINNVIIIIIIIHLAKQGFKHFSGNVWKPCNTVTYTRTNSFSSSKDQIKFHAMVLSHTFKVPQIYHGALTSP